MLSPEYDQPRTQQEIEEALSRASVVEIKRLSNPGVNIVGVKAS
jgi:hypothetical protein